MITPEEVGRLLIEIAKYDQRTLGRGDVEAWYAVAVESDWPSYPAALRAVIKHQASRPDDRIRPGHISVIIDEARRAARRSFRDPLAPDELRGDSEAQQAWSAERRHAWVNAWLTGWANGERNPGLRMVRELTV